MRPIVSAAGLVIPRAPEISWTVVEVSGRCASELQTVSGAVRALPGVFDSQPSAMSARDPVNPSFGSE